MLYAYTDESYSDLHYYQAAYIVTEGQLDSLETLVREVMTYASRFSVAPETELHGYSIMNAINGWEPLKGRYQRKISVYKILLRGLAEIGGSLIIQKAVEQSNELRPSENKSRHLATHSELMKKLNLYGEAHMAKIEIRSDQITTAKEILDHFNQNKTNDLQFLNDLEFVNSREFLGIQIVDVCLYVFQRAQDERRKDNRSFADANKMWELLKNSIYEGLESDFSLESTEGP